MLMNVADFTDTIGNAIEKTVSVNAPCDDFDMKNPIPTELAQGSVTGAPGWKNVTTTDGLI